MLSRITKRPDQSIKDGAPERMNWAPHCHRGAFVDSNHRLPKFAADQ